MADNLNLVVEHSIDINDLNKKILLSHIYNGCYITYNTMNSTGYWYEIRYKILVVYNSSIKVEFQGSSDCYGNYDINHYDIKYFINKIKLHALSKIDIKNEINIVRYKKLIELNE